VFIAEDLHAVEVALGEITSRRPDTDARCIAAMIIDDRRRIGSTTGLFPPEAIAAAVSSRSVSNAAVRS